MTQDRFARIKELLLKAADLPETERQGLLDDACADDPELRAEIEMMLERGADPSGILKTGGGISAGPEEPTTAMYPGTADIPQVIAGYCILQKLGEEPAWEVSIEHKTLSSNARLL